MTQGALSPSKGFAEERVLAVPHSMLLRSIGVISLDFTSKWPGRDFESFHRLLTTVIHIADASCSPLARVRLLVDRLPTLVL